MNDILRDLLLNGFIIYPNNGKFFVRKEAVPANLNVFKATEYDSYELAIEAANAMLNTPQMVDWLVIVRYDRGLGIEYKNMPDVQATNKEQAQAVAKYMSEQLLVEPSIMISEVKVRLKI